MRAYFYLGNLKEICETSLTYLQLLICILRPLVATKIIFCDSSSLFKFLLLLVLQSCLEQNHE
jgi:hypothetical protein